MKIIIIRTVVQSWTFADFDLYIGGETGKPIFWVLHSVKRS